jgi:STE24 endopeptidase
VKKGVISFSITALLAEAAYAMARNLPAIWWQAASLFWIAFSVFFIKLFPVLIIPLFYAYKPLSSGELRKRILLLAERFNIKVMDVSEIDFSKKTKKANAAVTGWGGTKRIILADNLVKEFSPGEIEVVVAHEMAHHKLGHVWKLIGAGSVPVVLFFYVIGAFGETICGYCGIGHILDISNLPLAWLVLSVLCLISMPLQNAFSRMLESEADRLSVEKTGSLSAFISLMEHLARTNLADRNPGRLMEFLFYSHPPIDRRIEAARRYDGI